MKNRNSTSPSPPVSPSPTLQQSSPSVQPPEAAQPAEELVIPTSGPAASSSPDRIRPQLPQVSDPDTVPDNPAKRGQDPPTASEHAEPHTPETHAPPTAPPPTPTLPVPPHDSIPCMPPLTLPPCAQNNFAEESFPPLHVVDGHPDEETDV